MTVVHTHESSSFPCQFTKSSPQHFTSKMARFAVKSLDHLVLTVRSIPETVAFYTEHLGMRHEIFTSPLNQSIQRYGHRAVTFNWYHAYWISTTRHALVFGTQKINLHEFTREFEPKAQNVQPGSADLCLLTEMDVDQVLQAFLEAGIEVRALSFYWDFVLRV